MSSSFVDQNYVGEPDGVVVIGSDYKIIAFNKSAERITGFSKNEVLKKRFQLLFSKNRQHAKYIVESLENGKPHLNLSLDITTADLTEKNVYSSVTPIIRSDNTIASVVFIFRDIREMLSLVKSLEEKNIESLDRKNMLEAIFDSRLEGTFTIDNNWEITSFNRAAEQITGYSEKEALGQKCWNIFQSKLCCNGCHMEYTMEKKKRSIDNELMIKNKDGKQVPMPGMIILVV